MRSVAILGGLRNRNLPPCAEGILHIDSGERVALIPARIMHLIVFSNFVSHSVRYSAQVQMKARGGSIYYIHGSRSALARAIEELKARLPS